MPDGRFDGILWVKALSPFGVEGGKVTNGRQEQTRLLIRRMMAMTTVCHRTLTVSLGQPLGPGEEQGLAKSEYVSSPVSHSPGH